MSSLPSPKTLDPLVKIGDVEHALADYFYVESRPNRGTIIRWIDSGKLRGKQINSVHYVYRSSLDEFLKKLLDQDVLAV